MFTIGLDKQDFSLFLDLSNLVVDLTPNDMVFGASNNSWRVV